MSELKCGCCASAGPQNSSTPGGGGRSLIRRSTLLSATLAAITTHGVASAALPRVPAAQPLAPSMDAPSSEMPNYNALLPQVQARALRVDPRTGYAIDEIRPGVYLLSDGVYQSLFVPTGKGVVLFDAPPSYAKRIPEAVARTTGEPIVAVIYSHAHVDHIGGTGLMLLQHPGLEIIAEAGVAQFLEEVADRDRPVPTRSFVGHETYRRGTLEVEMTVGHWHSPSGDLMIALPRDKVLMAVDTFPTGSVPFMGLDLTQDMPEYLKVYDEILERDWDVLVTGHFSNPAQREDARIAKEYVDDVYRTMDRVQRAGNPQLYAAAARKYGQENIYAIGAVVIDWEIAQASRELVSRWSDRLNSVDVWAASHCRTALVYDVWDVGMNGHAAAS